MELPLGKVTVLAAGTPVRATINIQPNPLPPGYRIAAHGIMFQVWKTNAGLVYIGHQGMNKTTGEGVLAVLGKPSFDSDGNIVFLPTFSIALTIAPNAMNPTMFFIDADNANDAVLVTALQA